MAVVAAAVVVPPAVDTSRTAQASRRPSALRATCVTMWPAVGGGPGAVGPQPEDRRPRKADDEHRKTERQQPGDRGPAAGPLPRPLHRRHRPGDDRLAG